MPYKESLQDLHVQIYFCILWTLSQKDYQSNPLVNLLYWFYLQEDQHHPGLCYWWGGPAGSGSCSLWILLVSESKGSGENRNPHSQDDRI